MNSTQLISIRCKILLSVTALFLGTSLYSQNWNEIIKTTASDRGINDNFGSSVSISGNYALIGARSKDKTSGGPTNFSDAGSAYIFERNVSRNWIEAQKITISDLSGKFVQSMQFANKQFLQLLIEELAGIYFLRIDSDNETDVIKLVNK
jgi:hypothetical protein